VPDGKAARARLGPLGYEAIQALKLVVKAHVESNHGLQKGSLFNSGALLTRLKATDEVAGVEAQAAKRAAKKEAVAAAAKAATVKKGPVVEEEGVVAVAKEEGAAAAAAATTAEATIEDFVEDVWEMNASHVYWNSHVDKVCFDDVC
jgi:hypothetical protein